MGMYPPCVHYQGSWKLSLRNSFKNFRRDHDTDKPTGKRKGNCADLAPGPGSKRRRTDDLSEEMPLEEYEKAVSELLTEWKKGHKKRNNATIKDLMEQTKGQRQKWIAEDNPLISQVLAKFPPLKQSKMVSVQCY